MLHHFVVVYDDATGRLFIDGEQMNDSFPNGDVWDTQSDQWICVYGTYGESEETPPSVAVANEIAYEMLRSLLAEYSSDRRPETLMAKASALLMIDPPGWVHEFDLIDDDEIKVRYVTRSSVATKRLTGNMMKNAALKMRVGAPISEVLETAVYGKKVWEADE